MKISPWLRPPGATRTDWALACIVWAVLGGVVFAGISLALIGLVGLMFRIL